MNKMKKWLFTLAATCLFFLPGLAWAAGGGGSAVVIVADTRKLTGIMHWWASVYNDSHLEFMIITIILIPLIGVIFGLLADLVMGRIGIDLKNRELAEH
ncbi:hypothetical protein LJC24_00370 [Desulfococcaceae bacterium OttesenSCG-928-F15]|nr:hypothetical protein [Desulfococcaceae bacterium OttesenSCG-928-F15]